MAESEKTLEAEQAARELAEQQMPGWHAVDVVPVHGLADGGTSVSADFSGTDIAALKAKYLGLAVDAGKNTLTNDDAKFVTMRPTSGVDVSFGTRKAVVSGGKLVGFQG